jgi:hypothetical protein
MKRESVHRYYRRRSLFLNRFTHSKKVGPVHTLKACVRRRGIAPLILNLSATFHVPAAFPLKQNPGARWTRRLGGHHRWSDILDKKKILCPQSAFESASLSVANSPYKLRSKVQWLVHSATCTNTGTICIHFMYTFRIKLTTASSDHFITQHGPVRLQTVNAQYRLWRREYICSL